MKVWRLAWNKPNVTAAFTAGKGEGRFNSRGNGVIYTSTALSLAVLEVLAHWEEYLSFEGYGIYSAEWDDIAAEHLPTDFPVDDKAQCQAYGDAWRAQRRSVALMVPSVLMPEVVPERNVIFNPEHPDYDLLRFAAHGAFELDARIARGLRRN